MECRDQAALNKGTGHTMNLEGHEATAEYCNALSGRCDQDSNWVYPA